MKIALLSNNRTIQGMFTLSVDTMEDVHLVVIDDTKKFKAGKYKWVFVDDNFPIASSDLHALLRGDDIQTVLLYHPDNKLTQEYDFFIKKPFLPSEIKNLIEHNTKSDKKYIDNSTKATDQSVNQKTNVLNLDEIEMIKALLVEEEMELVGEDDLADVVLQVDDTDDHNDALLYALKHMKPKKIRKLLQGAQIEIKITFPKETI